MTESPETPIHRPISIVKKITLSGTNKEEITHEARQYAIENGYLAFDFKKVTNIRNEETIIVEVIYFGKK